MIERLVSDGVCDFDKREERTDEDVLWPDLFVPAGEDVETQVAWPGESAAGQAEREGRRGSGDELTLHLESDGGVQAVHVAFEGQVQVLAGGVPLRGALTGCQYAYASEYETGGEGDYVAPSSTRPRRRRGGH